MVRRNGEHMRINTADEHQGLYLIGPDKATTKVAMIQVFTSRELIFQMPANLVAGAYRMQVWAGLKDTEGLATGSFEGLTVLPA